MRIYFLTVSSKSQRRVCLKNHFILDDALAAGGDDTAPPTSDPQLPQDHCAGSVHLPLTNHETVTIKQGSDIPLITSVHLLSNKRQEIGGTVHTIWEAIPWNNINPLKTIHFTGIYIKYMTL